MNKIKTALKHIREPFFDVELTDREREAVRLASHGHSVPEVIAKKMNVTPKTVYGWLKSASDKIGRELGIEMTFKDLTTTLMEIIEEILNE